MSGNVWEWVGDWYDENYYRQSPRDNPKGPSRGSDRISRGGSWDHVAELCRSAYRYDVNPGNRDFHQGFRLARTIP